MGRLSQKVGLFLKQIKMRDRLADQERGLRGVGLSDTAQADLAVRCGRQHNIVRLNAGKLFEEHARLKLSLEQADRELNVIRDEIGRLSLLAAEKVTRKSLTEADQRRLIDEALAEIDFTELEGSRS